MQLRNDSVLTAPEDAYERERLENFHPARWRNPQPADPYALVVVGAGPAGLTAAHSAASVGAKVALIERKDSDSKESASDNQSQIPEHQNWLFHIQGTEIAQGQPDFHSPYAGTNSLRSEDTFKQSSSVDIYLGAHLWPGGEIYFNPEYYQGFGLGNTHGIAAFPNAENYKIGQKIGQGGIRWGLVARRRGAFAAGVVWQPPNHPRYVSAILWP